eukprot:SAG31_NODE_7443_length_1687_cov_1.430459_1_plen_180_part_00
MPSRAYTEAESQLLLQIRSKLRASAYFSGVEDWARLFKKVDKDANGVVDAGELWKAISIASGGARDFKVPEQVNISKYLKISQDFSRYLEISQEVYQLFKLLDVDGNGGITYDEMATFLEGRTNTRVSESAHAAQVDEKKKARELGLQQGRCVSRAASRRKCESDTAAPRSQSSSIEGS